MPCADPAPWLLPISCDPLGRTMSGFGSHSPNSKAEGDVLCPGCSCCRKRLCWQLAEKLAGCCAARPTAGLLQRLEWLRVASRRARAADLLVEIGATLA